MELAQPFSLATNLSAYVKTKANDLELSQCRNKIELIVAPLAVVDVVDPKRHMVAVVSAAIKVCLVQFHCDASVG